MSRTSAAYPLVRNFIDFSTRSGVFSNPSLLGSSPSCSSRERMRLCIKSVYLTASLALGADVRVLAEVPPSVDALYARREDPVAARQAADQYLAHHRAAPQDFVGGWKLARASYFLGTQGPPAERRMWLE